MRANRVCVEPVDGKAGPWGKKKKKKYTSFKSLKMHFEKFNPMMSQAGMLNKNPNTYLRLRKQLLKHICTRCTIQITQKVFWITVSLSWNVNVHSNHSTLCISKVNEHVQQFSCFVWKLKKKNSLATIVSTATPFFKSYQKLPLI